jgi:hypothetical protein
MKMKTRYRLLVLSSLYKIRYNYNYKLRLCYIMLSKTDMYYTSVGQIQIDPSVTFFGFVENLKLGPVVEVLR